MGRRREDGGNGNRLEAESGGGNGVHPAEPERCEALATPYPSITALLMDPMPLWKRVLDVTVSLTALLLLSPLLLLIALAIKLTSPGPVIFKQPRVGYRGVIFPSWKFRSMRADADPTAHKKYLASLINQAKQADDESEDRPMIKLDKVDPRITLVGRFLRMSCLDELPQLVNVLKGEMSLVGPRPCLPYEAENYQRWHFQRLDTLPGITGLWQVKGKNKVTFRKMIRLDILYSRQRSLGLDLSILLQTIPAVLREIRDGMPAK
jgi:lipopolysaccharide/colanic/teichoic acid biosynthesis glycosyltransferase